MSEQPELMLPEEVEEAIQALFPGGLPDQEYVDRLSQQLSVQINGHNPKPSKFQTSLSVLVWGTAAILFILFLIWGINSLIPRTLPSAVYTPSITATNTPTTQPSTLSSLYTKGAIFYTVEAGDTLSTIEKKTGISIDMLHDLNAFLLQQNRLETGQKLLLGLSDITPKFYTVQERDTVQSISKNAGISIEDFMTINGFNQFSSYSQSTYTYPQFTLTPGIHVIIGLETNKDYSVLSEGDMNCDGVIERVRGIKKAEVEYFNISPQLSIIDLETSDSKGYKGIWQETAQASGVSYLAYQLFKADACNQFMVVIDHIGKEGVNVFRWDGTQVTNELWLPGRFLFEGKWMGGIFGDYKISGNTLYLGELQQANGSSKNIWILRGYQWIDGRLQSVVQKQVEINAGG
jgi:LysM repeat protein